MPNERQPIPLPDHIQRILNEIVAMEIHPALQPDFIETLIPTQHRAAALFFQGEPFVQPTYDPTPTPTPTVTLTKGTDMSNPPEGTMQILNRLTGAVIHTYNSLPLHAPYTDFSDADLQGLDLSRSVLTGCNFVGADLSNANLSSARCNDADFSSADLTCANLSNTNMNRAYLNSETELSGANLTQADFAQSRIWSVDFSTTNSLRQAYFYGASGIDEASWPSSSWSSSNPYWFNDVYGVEYCHSCATVCSSDDGADTQDDGWVCEDCGYSYCDDCDENYRDLDSHNDNYHDQDECDDYCSCGCQGSSRNIRNYSYKPNWNLHGLSKTRFGFELEICGPERHAEIVTLSNPSGDTLICKEDSSIPGGGFEIVSHPMDLDWFNRHFDHGLIPALRNAGMRTSDEAGLHIHVSRDAFSAPTRAARNLHIMSWLNLIYRNSDAMKKFARRDSDRWAGFHKPMKGELRQKATDGASYNWPRYQAVNCQNDYTFELRFFRSTLNRTKLRAALEFADASVEYTRNIRSRDVLRGNGLTWTHFYQWVITKPNRYPHLQQQMEELTADYIESL